MRLTLLAACIAVAACVALTATPMQPPLSPSVSRTTPDTIAPCELWDDTAHPVLPVNAVTDACWYRDADDTVHLSTVN